MFQPTSDTERQAQALLVAQSEVLARYAAQCESLVPETPSAPYARLLAERARLARAIASVYFRAGTADLASPATRGPVIDVPSGCSRCRAEITAVLRGDPPG